MADDSMIDDRTVAHVARLSRLELSPEEQERFREQLAEILAYVRRLDALDLAGVPPTAHVLPMANVLRDDEVRPSLTQAEALANAPAVDQGYFVVPPVITEDAPE
jgi:aspartyl-tRNA(Asn)/glutamyl-tRNA(Gln) amidotransferase subunit C